MVRQPSFAMPLLIAISGLVLWAVFRPAAALVVVVIAFLHWRFDLSDFGMRSRGWRGDFAAILLIGFLSGVVPMFMRLSSLSLSLSNGLIACLNRMFTNPASTTENLFYFGYLTERLSRRAGKWLTPPIIGTMYTLHEMSNPEYWYGGMQFGFVFIGITIFAAAYLWRRSVVAIWLADGFYRFISNLII